MSGGEAKRVRADSRYLVPQFWNDGRTEGRKDKEELERRNITNQQTKELYDIVRKNIREPVFH